MISGLFSHGREIRRRLCFNNAARLDHALVLDLYAEKTPHWNETDPGSYGGAEGGGEFLNTPWVYCMLNNFGGRLGLHGHIENFVNGVAQQRHRRTIWRESVSHRKHL